LFLNWKKGQGRSKTKNTLTDVAVPVGKMLLIFITAQALTISSSDIEEICCFILGKCVTFNCFFCTKQGIGA
jgi:hypothetical protein